LGIPLACFSLWRFYQEPRLRTLIALGIWLVWQFFFSIYLGTFLLMLLAAMVILLPFCVPAGRLWQRVTLWPRALISAWSRSVTPGRILSVVAIACLGLCLAGLMEPYYRVYRIYHFSRSWEDVSSQLPRLQSYLLADNSQIWPSSVSITTSIPHRIEHQLFPGVAVVLLLLAGILGRIKTGDRRMAWLHFWAGAVLVALTLSVNGLTLYHLVWEIPGMNSIRAVTRIFLVVMWPLSLFTAWTADGLLERLKGRRRWMQVVVYLAAGLLVAESIFYIHFTYSKAAAQARLDDLRQQIPTTLPDQPILFVARHPLEPFWAKELDAMLLTQDLSWPTLNGYSGNAPPGAAPADSCLQLPTRIKNYMEFAGIKSQSYYLELMKRAVPIGFADCDPTWWERMP
jgi:hypothetical protein